MDFILMDIKNFLKKLQNGQLEIEAGQWELHKDISNMRKMVNELKNLKEELGKVRISSLQQMGLIKDLQDKFDVFRAGNSDDQSINESALGSLEGFKMSDPEVADEDFRKKKCQLFESDEILEITSQTSKLKSDTDNEDSDLRIIGPRDEDQVRFAIDTIDNSCSDISANCYDDKMIKAAAKKPIKELSSPHYITSSTNQDILQRYLEDSAKYLGQKTSASTVTFQPSNTTACENELQDHDCPSFECGGCSSVIQVDSDGESQLMNLKDCSLWKGSAEAAESPFTKTTRKCSHKFIDKRHGKKQRMGERIVYCKTCGKEFSNRSRLKKHSAVHWMSSTSSKGFKCSYCKKICPTPEKLTQHLRKCRIITRSYHRMK